MWPGYQHPGYDQVVLCRIKPSNRHSLRVPSSSRLEIVLALDRLLTIGVRLSEYRAPVATGGLLACDELHSLGLYANLLTGKRQDEQEQATTTYPHTPRLSLLPRVVSPIGRRDIPRSFCALPRIALRTLSVASNELQYTGKE